MIGPSIRRVPWREIHLDPPLIRQDVLGSERDCYSLANGSYQLRAWGYRGRCHLIRLKVAQYGIRKGGSGGAS